MNHLWIAAIIYLIILNILNVVSTNTNTSTSTNLIPDARIIGGHAVSLVPYQVSVRLKYYDELQFGSGHICGGTLISQRAVVSAAHCVANTQVTPIQFRSASEFRLVMGSVDLYVRTPYVYNVISVQHNSGFNISTMNNDVALFFMNGRVPTGLTTVYPIGLNKWPEVAGTMCTVTGWGVTTTVKGKVSAVLMGAQVPIVSMEVCANAYASIGTITPGMLCAGYVVSGGIDACQGDSGGPLVCANDNQTLAGIVSWGNGCALSGYPGVYTNVSEYYMWIRMANASLDYNLYKSGCGNNQSYSYSSFIITMIVGLFVTALLMDAIDKDLTM